MKKYYENKITLRNVRPLDTGKIHGNLDYYIQEKLKNKTPYTFFSTRIKGTKDTRVTVRSTLPLSILGEKEVEIAIQKGQKIQFKLRVYSGRNKTLPKDFSNIKGGEKNFRKTFHGEEGWMIEDRLPKLMEKSGLKLIKADVKRSHQVLVTKKRNRPFSLPFMDLQVQAEIEVTEDFELALVNGVGKKRVYGLGMMRDIRIIE